MRRGRIFPLLFVGFLLVMVSGLFNRGAYRDGWLDGYVAGQTVESGETAAPAVPVPATRGPGWGDHPVGWFFGGILKVFLFMMLFGFLFKMVLFGLFGRRWRKHGGHGKRGHHRHGHGHGRVHRKWHDDDEDEPYEKQPEDVEPDIRTA